MCARACDMWSEHVCACVVPAGAPAAQTLAASGACSQIQAGLKAFGHVPSV